MSSIFTKIINREIGGYIVAEDDNHIAFLDINPLKEGHTLVVPKREEDYIFNIEDEEYKSLWLFAKKVGLGIEKVVKCSRIGIVVVGLEVPHTHIHLIPIEDIGDINFKKEKIKYSDEEFRVIAEKIRASIDLTS